MTIRENMLCLLNIGCSMYHSKNISEVLTKTLPINKTKLYGEQHGCIPYKVLVIHHLVPYSQRKWHTTPCGQEKKSWTTFNCVLT